MNRLTKHTEKGAVFIDCTSPCGECPATSCPTAHQEMLDRLADYEDTGLTPESVKTQKEFVVWVTADAESFYRLRELAEVDKEGRVVVLPCNVGDTVYMVDSIGIDECRVREVYWSCNEIESDVQIYLRDKNGLLAGEYSGEFGRTVFRSREDAKRALAERKAKENADPAD